MVLARIPRRPVPRPTPPGAPAASMWRTTPDRLMRLVVGLLIFGVGDALIVRSELGNTPWTVNAEGISLLTPLTIGQATIATGVVLLLLWIPLGVRPGLGTILNVVLIGLAIDATLALTSQPDQIVVRAALLLGGIGLVGVGSGLYLGVRKGPGPRDGLMTGLHDRTGWPIRRIRLGIEVTALATGWLMGGTAGVGTVVFAVLIGYSVQAGIALDQRLWEGRRPRRTVADPVSPPTG